MDQLKFTASLTAPADYAGLLERPSVAYRPIALVAAVLALGLVAFTALTLAWRTVPVAPSVTPGPISADWACSMGNASIGTLSVNGWDYVLAQGDNTSAAGAIALDRNLMKFEQDMLKVPSGALRDTYGVKLGFHFNVAGLPERLVFNVAPGLGINCNRA